MCRPSGTLAAVMYRIITAVEKRQQSGGISQKFMGIKRTVSVSFTGRKTGADPFAETVSAPQRRIVAGKHSGNGSGA